MFWILVLACGGAGTGPEGSPGGGGSIFDPDETPAFPAGTPPSFPAQPPPEGAVTAPSFPAQPPPKDADVPAPASQAPVLVSQACQSARDSLDVAEKRVVRIRNARITPAADRVDAATEVMAGCVRDVTGCGNRAGAYKKDLVSAEAVYDKALNLVSVEEATLFPLVQAVESACYPQ